VLDALLCRWRLLVASAVVGAVVGAAATRLYEPPAEVIAKVMVQENTAVNPFLEDMMVDWSVENRLPVTRHLIESRRLSLRTLRELGEIDDSTPTDTLDRKIEDLQRRLDIYSLGDGVVKIKYRHREPVEALEGLDVIIEIFVSEMLRPQKQSLDESVTFLERELERVERDLETREEELRVYKESHADELPVVYRANLGAYLKLLEARHQVQAELASEAVRSRVSSRRLSRYDPETRELESKLVEARVELQSLQTTFRDRHPRVEAMAARVRQLEREYERAVRRAPRETSIDRLASVAERLPVGAGTGADRERPKSILMGQLIEHQESSAAAEALEVKLDEIDGSIAESLERITAHAANEKSIRQMNRDIETKSAIYQQLLTRYEEAKVTRHLTLSEEEGRVWIIDRPTRPPALTRLHPLLGLAGGGVGALGLAAVLALVLEFFSSTIRTRYDVEELESLAVLGELPLEES
jgi:uncharacterized protein involved in exopolysaccharide biosynthesis